MDYWNLSGLVIATVMISAVAACGGGGIGDDAAPVPVGKLQLSGTAAVGLALAGANVTAKCERGTGSTVTGADGSYKLLLDGGTAPCALQVIAADGTKLHSLALGSATGAVIANLTPLTDMVTVRVARTEAATYFSRFDATESKKLTVEGVKAAQADVTTLLAGTVDTAALGDFLATPLKAATPANPKGGDAQDQLLDTLYTKLGAEQRAQVLAALASGAVATDPGTGAFKPVLTVEPQQATVPIGATQVLMANINYPKNVAYIRQPVSWRLVEAEGGKVDLISGRYTAPAKPGTYHVRATRDDYPEISATVTITVPVFQSLDITSFSGIGTAQTAVVRDAAAWGLLWAQHKPAALGGTPVPAPAVDFSKDMVVGVFSGMRPTGCDAVAIVNTVQGAAKLTVQYRETTPQSDRDRACTMVVTTPAHLVKLPRSDAQVEFFKNS